MTKAKTNYCLRPLLHRIEAVKNGCQEQSSNGPIPSEKEKHPKGFSTIHGPSKHPDQYSFISVQPLSSHSIHPLPSGSSIPLYMDIFPHKLCSGESSCAILS